MKPIEEIRLNEEHKEILPMDPESFPYVCMYREMDHCIGHLIPWHWHPFFEIDYVDEGIMEYSMPDKTEVLKAGDVIFINADILHEVRTGKGSRGCRVHAHLFDADFLSGMYNSVFEQRYILPIRRSRELQSYVIHPDNRRHLNMIDCVLTAMDLAEEKKFGYEFELRASLSRFWYQLVEETEEVRKTRTPDTETGSNRMKRMLQYIQSHYDEKIRLSDIAQSASVSERECTRCFRSCMNRSPVEYLNLFRIRTAAAMLLKTDDCVMRISESCGFSSDSYFGKLFHDIMGCTPKAYRSRYLKESLYDGQ